mmetsp:Transcript_62371/g.71521  ORF Transcript_62371/g.71521 Transcript_62371/m.71521 type:complete len:307 (-) Transcript_62371:17-937(-)
MGNRPTGHRCNRSNVASHLSFRNRAFRDGISQLKKGDWMSAHEKFSTCLEINRLRHVVRFLHGYTFFKLGCYVDAIRDYSSYVLDNHDDWKGFYMRGINFLAIKEYSHAIVDFSSALIRHPFNVAVLWQRALASLSIKNYADAIDDFKLCLEIMDQNDDVYEYGREMGWPDVLDLDLPDRSCVLQYLADSAYESSRFSEALQLYSQLLTIRLEASNCYKAAECYLNQQKFESAINCLTMAVGFEINSPRSQREKNENLATFYECRAKCMMKLSKFSHAASDADRAFRSGRFDLQSSVISKDTIFCL